MHCATLYHATVTADGWNLAPGLFLLLAASHAASPPAGGGADSSSDAAAFPAAVTGLLPTGAAGKLPPAPGNPARQPSQTGLQTRWVLEEGGQSSYCTFYNRQYSWSGE